MKTLTTIPCPRCGNELEANKNSSMHCCIGCDGALVSQSALQPLLKQIAKEFADDGCLSDVIVTVPEKCGDIECPHCRRPMDHTGHHSTDSMKIDGCLRCWVVWTDADRLAVMAALQAQSKRECYEDQQPSANGKDPVAHSRAIQRIRKSYRNVRF